MRKNHEPIEARPACMYEPQCGPIVVTTYKDGHPVATRTITLAELHRERNARTPRWTDGDFL